MEILKNMWEKIKSIKHLQIVVAIAIGLVLCAAIFAYTNLSTTDDSASENSTQESTSAEAYVSALENKLNTVLSKISGAGQVYVLITLQSGFSYTYATDTETKTTTSGSTETSITTETVIFVSDEPVVLQETYPQIKGVVVVASGASDFAVKMSIIAAIETALEVDSDCITVLS